jgi:hypothetical protein
MEHLICRVEHFEIVAPYTVRGDFDDSTRQVINFRPFSGKALSATSRLGVIQRSFARR